MEQGEIILYQPDEAIKLEVRMEDETVWLTQAQIVELFQSSKANISEHSELPTPKGMSFGENSPLFFPASFCHCFLGHEVVHPQEGSPQA